MCHVMVHAGTESFASDELQYGVGYKHLCALSHPTTAVSAEKAGRSSSKKVGVGMIVSRAIGRMLWNLR